MHEGPEKAKEMTQPTPGMNGARSRRGHCYEALTIRQSNLSAPGAPSSRGAPPPRAHAEPGHAKPRQAAGTPRERTRASTTQRVWLRSGMHRPMVMVHAAHCSSSHLRPSRNPFPVECASDSAMQRLALTLPPSLSSSIPVAATQRPARPKRIPPPRSHTPTGHPDFRSRLAFVLFLSFYLGR